MADATTTTTNTSTTTSATTAAPATTATTATPAVTATTTNALTLLATTLAGYGLDTTGTMSQAILGLLQNNYDSPTIQALIEDPGSLKSADVNVKNLATAWQTRFSGNTARITAGLTPLTPAEYISTENSYKALMSRAGLDASHQDPTVLASLIGTDVSPTEVNQRINAAYTAITAEDPFVVQQLQSQFNLTTGDLIGHLLNPSVQSSVIANKVTAAQIGAEATRQGLNAGNAYSLATQGITQAQAQAGYGAVAQVLPAGQKLSNIYGTQTGIDYNQTAAEQQYLLNNGAVALEQQKLKSLEEAQFGGKSGIIAANAQSGYGGSLGKSIQGQF